jgi:hypothetical protein
MRCLRADCKYAPGRLPMIPIGHLLPLANENRWSDLLAVFIEADPGTASAALGLQPPLAAPRVRREGRGSGKDRIDLLVHEGDQLRAVIEIKVLSGLGRRQLDRYRTAHPDAGAYLLVYPRRLPLHLPSDSGWTRLTWDEMLTAFVRSPNAWVAETAAASKAHLDAALPDVGPDTSWNDLRPGEDFVIALRARMSWVYGAMQPPSPIVHDLVESAAGVSWVPRMSLPAVQPGYLIRVEAEEYLPVRDFPKYASLTGLAPRGPSVKVCLVQTRVTTSAGFDWGYLLSLWRIMGPARDDWVTAPARPKAEHDRAGWQRMVAAGGPKYLGIGFGEAQARRAHECMFGARFQLPPDVTLQRVANELHGTADLMLKLASP